MNIINKVKRRVTDNINKKANLVKSLTTDPNRFIKNLMYGHDKLPYSFRAVFDKVKDEKITSLEVIRNPLSKPLEGILSAFTGFELERKLKQENYDHLFHLKIRINGKYDFEKEQASHFGYAKNNPDQEIMKIHEIPNETIEEFVENTIKKMGNAFFNYDGLRNNCQDFILAVLHGNGIHNSQYDSWIKQNTDEIFKSTPSFMRKVMNKVTDIANRAQILEEGTGIKTNYQHKNVLSNFDIQRISQKLGIKLNGIYMKDQINNNNLTNGNYIMNLQNHNQSGSHWVAFVKSGKSIYYCDSYGVLPPENESKLFLENHYTVYVNTHQFQPLNSDKCGWYAMSFLYAMKNNTGSYVQRFKQFTDHWNYKKLNENEIVRKLLLNEIK